jgi:predicted RNase H-like nuclease (RuvC/YqgF family)
MDEAWGTYSQEYEIRGMDVHLGIEGTNSNGHGEGRDENMNMVETIKKLQKDVQSHKDDNERLMKANEQQDDFNVKLMQFLNKIENKLDKESGSSKSGSHRPSDEKIRERSVSRHHHHSPRHSNNRAHSSSSPSPVRQA